MNKQLPERPDLDQLRKQAKELQKAFRAGEPEAIARVGDVKGAKLSLLDAQRTLAREYGFPSWAKLKLHIEALETGLATARLVVAATHGDQATLSALLADRPKLARQTVSACAVLGDVEGLRAWVAKNSEFARASGGLCDAGALTYVCLGRLGGDETARVACADLLLSHGADPNATWKATDGYDGRLPTLYAAVGMNNYPNLARRLLAAGAKPDDGESVFHAAEKNHRECLEALLAAGADIGGRDRKWKNTPLYFLLGWSPGAAPAAEARAGIVWLLEHGANPNVSTYDHAETPLFPAVRNGWDLDLIRLMLDRGADATIRRADGTRICSVAVKAGRADVVDLLVARGAVDEATPAERFLGAVAGGREAEARERLATNPAWRQQLAGEITALLVGASRRGDVGPVRVAGALELDCDQPGDNGGRPLHWAAWHGQLAAVMILVELGADLNRRDASFNAPPLGWCVHGSANCRAITGDYGTVAEVFLAAGADRPPHGAAGGSAAVQAAFARYPK
ncbi:MAG TPA: hypothetical protein VHD32_04750 [Candidatus Didemnitutus sp.]|nr:hypothetical protein [Candidatus Didemnitutus sp.]